MSVEDWALEMIPRPVLAVMLLFPIKEAVIVVATSVIRVAMHFTLHPLLLCSQSEKHREEEHAKILEEGQVLAPSLYFTKQSASAFLHYGHASFVVTICRCCWRVQSLETLVEPLESCTV